MKYFFKYLLYSVLTMWGLLFPSMMKSQNNPYVQELNDAIDVSLGLHTGFFDSNQSVRFPYNIGVITKFEYTPDIFRKLYLGSEAGLFFTASQKDKLGRETKLVFADISLFPGISFPIKSNISIDDNHKTVLKKLKSLRKIRLALGLNIAIPLKTESYGSGVNNNAINTGIGITFRINYDLPGRINVFANLSRISKDLDGYAFKGSDSTERSYGNKHNVSYIMKIGVCWHLLKKS